MKVGFSDEPWRRFYLRSWHNWVMRGVAAVAVLGFSAMIVFDESDTTWKLILVAAAALSAGKLNWKAYVTLTPSTVSLTRGPRDPGAITRESIQFVAPTGVDRVEITYRRRSPGLGGEYPSRLVLTLEERDTFLLALDDLDLVRRGVSTPFWPVERATIAGLCVALTALAIGLGRSGS